MKKKLKDPNNLWCRIFKHKFPTNLAEYIKTHKIGN